MKRSMLLVVAVTLAFAACQKKNEVNEEMSPAVETTPAVAPAPAPAAVPADTMTVTPATVTPATSSM